MHQEQKANTEYSQSEADKAIMESLQHKLEQQKEKLRELDRQLAERSTIIENISALERSLLLYDPLRDTKGLDLQMTPRVSGKFANLSTRKATRIVLERAGRPLYSKEIAKQIMAGGKDLGKRPVSLVTSVLKQASTEFSFEKIKNKNRWYLLDQPAKSI